MKKLSLVFFYCALLYFTSLAQNCDNWLFLPSYPSYVSAGDLDVGGNQVTVEAEINMTLPYSGGPSLGSDIVGKYRDPSDANYLLRVQNAQITTTSGFYKTPDLCPLELNKTYHVAMVYDGSSLKYYRNGFLVGQVAATGNLILNDWQSRIGFYQYAFYNTNFIGYINEVRIWNVARTQAQIQAYMNTSLPSPATQVGLLAYFTFDDLLNKQGNPTWNATLGGSAAINQTNPTCASFIADNKCCPLLSGTITGGTICAGDAGYLTFHSTATSTPPYTIAYSDGTNNYTQSNVQDGVPFAVASPPTATTNYSLISIQDAGTCAPTLVSGQAATIGVGNCCPQLSGTFSGNSVCTGQYGLLTFNLTSTMLNSPFVITYSDGVNTYVQQNVEDGVPFSTPIPVTKDFSFPLLSIKDASACAATTITGEAAAVLINPDPVLQITKDTSICIGSSAQLQVSGADSYQWSPAAALSNAAIANPIASPATETRFFVTGTDLLNCQGKASVLVSIFPKVVFDTPPDASVCIGGTVRLDGANSPKYSYQWSPADFLDDAASPSPVAGPPQSMPFNLTVTNPVCGEHASFAVNVQVNPLPVVSASRSNDLDCVTGVSQLTATGAQSYTWAPAAGLSDAQLSNPVAAIDSTTTFTVTGTDGNGCSSTDEVTVVVTAKGKAQMVLPNAFTPNGDGHNDCFGIRRWGNVTVQEFAIYNRWGQKVFETHDPSGCWDGTFKGERQDTGQYVYVIKAVSFCGNITRTGTVLLIR